MTLKITALTTCCVDLYPELDQVYVGGNSLNFATQCIRSGIKDVSVIGAVGDDQFAPLIEQHLDQCAIDRTRLYRMNAKTASNKIFIDEQGDRYFKADSWNGGAFDVFRLSEDDWKHLEERHIVAMPGGDPNLTDLLKRRNDQHVVVVDFMDYLPLEFVAQRIDGLDIAFISARDEMLDDLNALATKSGKMIVATLGAKGSIAFWNNTSYFQEAEKADEIVDTTGCGDAFQAAFTIEWVQSKDIKKALRAGSLAAKHVLGFKGGVE